MAKNTENKSRFHFFFSTLQIITHWSSPPTDTSRLSSSAHRTLVTWLECPRPSTNALLLIVQGQLQRATLPLSLPAASRQGETASSLARVSFTEKLDRSTELMKVPSVHLGQMPWTGQPKLQVQVDQRSSRRAVAPDVSCLPVLRSQNSSQQAPQVDCRKQLSLEMSICVMQEECFLRGAYLRVISPLSQLQTYMALSWEPITSVLQPNFMSDIHYLACLKASLGFNSLSFSENLYTRTVPFLDPTTSQLPSGDRQTALDLDASEQSLVFGSFSNQILLLSLSRMKLVDAQHSSRLLRMLQHLTVASSEHVKIKSPRTYRPQTSFVHVLLGLQWHFKMFLLYLKGLFDVRSLNYISYIYEPSVPTASFFPMMAIALIPTFSDLTSEFRKVFSIQNDLTTSSLFLLITKIRPSLVPASRRSPQMSMQSTTEVGTFYSLDFRVSEIYFLASVPDHTSIVPLDAPVQTFLESGSKTADTKFSFLSFFLEPYLPVSDFLSTLHTLYSPIPTVTKVELEVHTILVITLRLPFTQVITALLPTSSTATWWSSSMPAHATKLPSGLNATASTPFLTGPAKMCCNAPSLQTQTEGLGPSSPVTT